jgi:hypothetical protein
MRFTKERLYSLLPAIYRTHDAKLGSPLEALIGIIAEEVEVIENDIGNLYANWFIETCDEWAIPYIGDLVGAQIPFSSKKKTASSSSSSTSSSSNLNDIINDNGISHRPWVANTLGYRRRKGTVAVLEQLASDVTGWKAKIVEFFRLTNTTHNLNRHPSQNNSNLDLRGSSSLNQILTPFDSVSHLMDVRAIGQGGGYHNVSNVGIFLWRIQPYPILYSPAFDHLEGRYSFNQLGIDAPLFNHPVTESDFSHLVEEPNLPIIITRSTLRNNIEEYYGKERSVFIEVDGAPLNINEIIVEDLGNWQRPPHGKSAAIDPLLGRITFPLDRIPQSVKVKYYYGFSADIGGGLYEREERAYHTSDVSATSSASTLNMKIYKISKLFTGPEISDSISGTISRWSSDNRPSAIFELIDSEFYEEDSIHLALPSNCKLVIRSANRQRPVLRAPFKKHEQSMSNLHALIEIVGEKGSAMTLDGLLIDKSLRLEIKSGELKELLIRHCTMVPATDPSIKVDDKANELNVTINHSICGNIESTRSEARFTISNSIIDGNPVVFGESEQVKSIIGTSGMNTDKAEAARKAITIRCYGLDLENSTIFGKVNVELINATNTIFTEKMTAKRRQWGCIRYSYIPSDSEAPRCFECQPERNETKDGRSIFGPFIFPRFTSDRYGDPAYGQLHKNIDARIFEGADNRSEMGAFNNLYQPQRINNIKSALEEYLRFGIEAGIILIDLSEQNYEGRYY